MPDPISSPKHSGVSMAQERNQNIAQAFRAMKELGIPAEKVKPVLKELLKVYEGNWELIRENNYTLLADHIFESNEEHGAMVNDNLEPPSKKPHGALPEDRASSSGSRKIDAVGVLLESNGQGSQSLPRNGVGEPRALLHKASVRDTGMLPMSTCQARTRDNILVKRETENFCDGNVNERTVLKSGRGKTQEDTQRENVTQRKRKEVVNLIPLDIHPSNFHPDKGKQVGDSAYHYGASLQSSFNIVSSNCRRVKVFLTCNHAYGQLNSRSPNLDAVMKHAGDKYLRSCKIFSSKFSLIQLLKELCNSYLELGSFSGGRCLIEESSGDFPSRGGDRKNNIEIDTNKRVKSSESSNSSGLVVMQQQQPSSHEKGRAFQKLHDITNGTEKVSISLVDEIGNEHLPNFVYIHQNTVYQSAYVHVSLARIADDNCCASCMGDCLKSPFPCACARDTGGVFAYTPQGLLREEFLDACISMNVEPQKHHHYYCPDCPLERAKNASSPQECKGHLVRRFVKECWRKCRCNMQCGNRVVQRGINRKLQVFLTADGKGWGVRTLEELPKGAFVCEYVGEILTNMELYERNKQSGNKDRHTYPVLLDADWGSERVLKDEDALCLDATYYGNVGRFINHRCFDANLIDVPVEVETPDHHYYRLVFFTKRKVEVLQELTWDYGIDFNDHNHPIKAFQCCCGSDYCRDLEGTKKQTR